MQPSMRFISFLKKVLNDRFVRFLLVGFLNTCFGYCLYAIFILVGLSPTVSVTVAYWLGVAFNFFTTGRVVFGNSNVSRLPRFFLAYGLAYAANLLVLSMFLHFGLHPLAAQAASLPPVVVFTFLLLRGFVFRP